MKPRVYHGLAKGRPDMYARWANMMTRCYNPDFPGYVNYGARGISVCQEWHDVRIFVRDLDELLGPRPDGWGLDRIDNDGNYEPGNVRWASRSMQNRNKRYATEVSSSYRGVSWSKWKGRWRAAYGFNKRSYFIGYFDSEEEAAAAYRDIISNLEEGQEI